MKYPDGVTQEFKDMVKRRKKYLRERSIQERIYDLLIKILWRLDETLDASGSYESIGYHYPNAPENIKGSYMRVDKFYHIDHDDPQKSEIIAWLEREE